MKIKEQKRKKMSPVWVVIIIILVAAFVAVLAYGFNILSKLNHNELDKDGLGITTNKDEQIVDDKNDVKITNIALFGIDQRNGVKQSRSDAIMVLSVDKQHNKIKLSSIMRDLLVPIEGNGQDKINHAYFVGGPQLAVKTLNQNFNLNIEEYATVNFQQMASIVDAVGGIDIEMSAAEIKAANGSIQEQSVVAGLPKQWIEKTAGMKHLTGTQAVAYGRIRHVGNADFERTDRQREVLQKLFDKALAMNPLEYPEFARKMLPTVETSLDWGEIINLAGIMLRDVKFEDLRLPRNEDLIGNGSISHKGQSCVNANIEQMATALNDFIYNDTISSDTTK